jgi:hypothetical protein
VSAANPLTITLSNVPVPAADGPTREVRTSDGQVLLYLVSPGVMEQSAATAARVAELERQVAQLREDLEVTRRQMMALVPQARYEEEEEMQAFLQQKFVPFDEVLAALGVRETK